MNFPIDSCGYKIDTVNMEGSIPHTHTIKSEIIQTFENSGNVLINGELYRMQKKRSLFYLWTCYPPCCS